MYVGRISEAVTVAEPDFLRPGQVMGPDGHTLTGPAAGRFVLAWSLPLISFGEPALQL
jgi:hypothetical protein